MKPLEPSELTEPTRRPMCEVVHNLKTKSDKIRSLLNEGYLRTEVALFLDIRYQHVRRVAEAAGIRSGLKRAARVMAEPVPVLKVREDVAIAVLAGAGFQKIGFWVADGSGGIELNTPPPTEPGVYAFVVGGLIMYIGVSRRGIRARMLNYRFGHKGQKTSNRLRMIIKEQIAANAVVEIYAATPQETTWNGLPVATAAGLEAGLIKMIQPPWNRMGVIPQ